MSVGNGVYSVQIGSLTALSVAVFDGDAVYLEIQVDDNADLSSPETLLPRERLVASAYAVHSLSSERGRDPDPIGHHRLGHLIVDAAHRFVKLGRAPMRGAAARRSPRPRRR